MTSDESVPEGTESAAGLEEDHAAAGSEEDTPAAPGSEAASAAESGAEAPTEPEGAPAETVHAPMEVRLQRSVRIGRLIIAGAVVGALFGAIGSLFFPVEEGSQYDLGQIAGLMLVVGGAIGLLLGAVLALILNLSAKRKTGAAMAVQTDVG